MKWHSVYTWPFIGPLLCKGRQRQGREITSRLLGRFPPHTIIQYARRSLHIAVVEHDEGKIHEFTGMIERAQEFTREHTQNDR